MLGKFLWMHESEDLQKCFYLTEIRLWYNYAAVFLCEAAQNKDGGERKKKKSSVKVWKRIKKKGRVKMNQGNNCHGRFRRVWSLLLTLMLVISTIVTPVQAANYAEPLENVEQNFSDELTVTENEGTESLDDTGIGNIEVPDGSASDEVFSDNVIIDENTSEGTADETIPEENTDGTVSEEETEDVFADNIFTDGAAGSEDVFADSEEAVSLAGAGTAEDPYLIQSGTDLPAAIDEGVYYALAADITLTGEQQIQELNGVLDGKGHTVTLAGQELIYTLNGTVQNLGISSASYVDVRSGDFVGTLASAAYDRSKILNCYSLANIGTGETEPITVGGLTGSAAAGCIISNSYFAGTINGADGWVIGGIAAVAQNETNISCYYVADGITGEITGNVEGVIGVAAEEFKANGADLLNANIPNTGYFWCASEGYPVLAEGTAPVLTVDKAALEAAVAEAEDLNKEEYTEDSWAAFSVVLEEAKVVLEKQSATQEEVTAAAEKLNAAKEDLVKLATKEEPDTYLGVKTEARVYDDFENDIWLQFQHKQMQVGDTASIYPWRMEQVVTDVINNDVGRPNFHFDIIKGDSISLSATESTYKVTAKAEKPGTTVVKVTYDALDYKGKHWNAISPVNTAYAVFTVGENGKATIATDERFDKWLHYNTIYYNQGETVPYTFTVDTANAESVKVTVNGLPIQGEGNQYTANLENRSNIIGIEAKDSDGNISSKYRVIDARFMEVNVANKTNPEQPLKAGDTANISFRGITMPVYKIATIYNPQMGKNATRVTYSNEKLGSFEGKCGQWDLATNNDFDVTFTEGGDYTFTSEKGIICTWWGSPLGTDMTQEGSGEPNLNAPTIGNEFCDLPDFTVTVEDAVPEEPDTYLGVKTEARVYDDFENDIWLQFQHKQMQVGDTASIYPWRMEQVVTDVINNDVGRPNFHFDIIKGDSISLNKTEDTYKVTATAEKPGTTVVKVTYDALDYKGRHWEAISDVNTAYAVFTVGETGKATITTNEEFDKWRHYDTIYYNQGETVPYTFTVDTANAESVKVTVNGLPIQGEGNQYTANLENRSNIIGIEAKDSDGNITSKYRVIDARFIEVNVANKTNPEQPLKAGDTATISFRGITMPVYKIATIYNPCFNSAWGGEATHVLYTNDKLGTFKGKCSQWDLATNNDFDVTFTEAGEYAFTSDGIYCEWWGSPLGTDITQEGSGEPNLNAPILKDYFSVMPDFTVTVVSDDKVEADKVEDLINNLPSAEDLTLDDAEAMESAKSAYKKLTEEQKKLLSEEAVSKLEELNKVYTELKQEAKKISVTFTLLGDISHKVSEDGHTHTYAESNLTTWIPEKTYLVDADYKVVDILNQALEENNMTCENPSGNYVSSITKDGVTLKEFGNGSGLSGWMYLLNGYYPDWGVNQQELSDNDTIIFHWTDDYSKEKHYHNWSKEWSFDEDYHWHNCTLNYCPVKDNAEKDGYGAHKWDNGKVTKAPTCAATGIKTYTCDCGATKTETLPATGAHKWSGWKTTKNATAFTTGIQERSCSVCKKKETKTIAQVIPELVSAKATAYNKTVVTWKKASGADGYRVYRKTGNGGWQIAASNIKGYSTTSFTDTKVTPGTKYTYTVKPYRRSGSQYVWGKYDTKGISVIPHLGTPQLVSAKATAYNTNVVTWKKASGAQGYRVYRKTGNSGWQTVAKNIKGYSSTSFTDKKAEPGIKYTYTVRSYRKCGSKYVWSNYNTKGVSATPQMSRPKLVSAKAYAYNTVKVAWNKVSGATRYYVYRKAEGSKWQNLGSSTGTSFTDKKAEPGVTYIYTVRAYRKTNAGTYLSPYYSSGIKAKTFLSTPKLVSAKKSGKDVKVTWNSVSGSQGYYVYRKVSGGNWKKVGTVTNGKTVTFTDKNAASKKYIYTVRAYRKNSNNKTVLSSYDTRGIAVK